jgi:hypothetical protein
MTIVMTGFMTQYCMTTARGASDPGSMSHVIDACDVMSLFYCRCSGIDENAAASSTPGVSVADVTSTDDVVARMGGLSY